MRVAGPDDAEVLVAVLEEASAWLRSRGILQWPERFTVDWFGPALDRGETSLIFVDGTVAATITLSWTDRAWPEDAGDAGYVHRFAVLRWAAGIGAELLAWADDQVRAAGRAYLRLDCVADNPALREYYERASFEHRGDVPMYGTTISRYERRA